MEEAEDCVRAERSGATQETEERLKYVLLPKAPI